MYICTSVNIWAYSLLRSDVGSSSKYLAIIYGAEHHRPIMIKTVAGCAGIDAHNVYIGVAECANSRSKYARIECQSKSIFCVFTENHFLDDALKSNIWKCSVRFLFVWMPFVLFYCVVHDLDACRCMLNLVALDTLKLLFLDVHIVRPHRPPRRAENI